MAATSHRGPSLFGGMVFFLVGAIVLISACVWAVRKVDHLLFEDSTEVQASMTLPNTSGTPSPYAQGEKPPVAPVAMPAVEEEGAEVWEEKRDALVEDETLAEAVTAPPSAVARPEVREILAQEAAQGAPPKPTLRQAKEPWKVTPLDTWPEPRRILYGRTPACVPKRCAWFETDCQVTRCNPHDIYRRVRVVSRLAEEARTMEKALVLRGVELSGAVLDGIDLRGADLRMVDLAGASLRGADLRGAQLQGANLREADLQGADLRRTRLDGADLAFTRLDKADLQGASLVHAKLEKTRVFGAVLEKVDGASAQWEGVSLDGARLGEADLSFAVMHAVDLDDADLHGVSLYQAKVRESSLRKANLRGAQLHSVTLARVDLSEASLEGAKMDKLEADEVTWKGANYDNTTLWPRGLRFKDQGAQYLNGARGKRVPKENLAHPRPKARAEQSDAQEMPVVEKLSKKKLSKKKLSRKKLSRKKPSKTLSRKKLSRVAKSKR